MKIRKALEKARESRQEETLMTRQSDVALDDLLIIDEKPEHFTPTNSQAIELNQQKLRDNRMVSMFPEAPELDSYKILRTQILRRTREKGWKTLMVTSALPGEGKTFTSINLAITFAKEFDQTVLLVDCDLRRQGIHKQLGFASPTGLIDYLDQDRPLQDLLIWPGIDKLTLISGGRTIQESTELLGSAKMKALVAEMKNRYDDRYVIFDTPPILGGADTIAFAPLVDCIIMVVEAERTPRRDIAKCLELLPQEKFLGFVLNRHQDSIKEYEVYGKTYNNKA